MTSLLRTGVVVALACLATAAVCAQSFAQWRLQLLRMKLSGNLATVAWTELLSRMSKIDPEENGGRWILGNARVVSIDSSGPCPASFDTPFGEFVGHLTDEWHLEHTLHRYLGLGPDSAHGLNPLIEPGDTVVEVGAWVGTFTRYALLQGAAKVIAVEPIPGNVECFRRNFEQELADGRVKLIVAAAWREPGVVRMSLHSPNNHRNSLEGALVDLEGEIEVRAVTLDEVLAGERVDVLNIDTEGAERHVLAGAAETIRRDKPDIAVCIHHLPDDADVLLPLFAELAPEHTVRSDGFHARLLPSSP